MNVSVIVAKNGPKIAVCGMAFLQRESYQVEVRRTTATAVARSLRHGGSVGGRRQRHRILGEEQPLAPQPFSCSAELLHVACVSSVALRERWSRIAGCQPLGLRAQEWNLLPRRIALQEVDVHR